MKKILSLLLVTLTAIFLVACGNSNHAAKNEIKAELSSMPKIEGFTYYGDIPKAPKRIASLSSTYTGYLLQLDFEPVAVTSYDAKNPVIKDKVAKAKVASSADLETLTSLKPDLIIIDSSDEKVQQLSKIAPTIAIDYGKHDYLAILNRFGEVFAKEEQAEKWIADWKKETAEVGKSLKAKLGEEATFTVSGLFEKEIYLFGNNWGRGGEVIYQALGFKAPQKVEEEVFSKGYLAISQEVLPEYVGDFLLVAAENEETGAALYESDVWKSIPAVQKGHVLKVDANAFYFNDPLSLTYELETIKSGLEKMN